MFKCPECESILPNSRRIYHEFQECKVRLNSNKGGPQNSNIIENNNNYDNDLEYAIKLEKEINGERNPIGD